MDQPAHCAPTEAGGDPVHDDAVADVVRNRSNSIWYSSPALRPSGKRGSAALIFRCRQDRNQQRNSAAVQ